MTIVFAIIKWVLRLAYFFITMFLCKDGEGIENNDGAIIYLAIEMVASGFSALRFEADDIFKVITGFGPGGDYGHYEYTDNSAQRVIGWIGWIIAMTNNGEWYDVKLKFTGKYAMIVQDYLYGKNQITECVDSNTTILTLQMQYKDSIVGFVLSHGIYCEVLEPEWLKQEVKETAEKITKLNNRIHT